MDGREDGRWDKLRAKTVCTVLLGEEDLNLSCYLELLTLLSAFSSQPPYMLVMPSCAVALILVERSDVS